MNSSTGFKKRNLLRPASGILNKQKQLLKVLDLGQSEPLINSAIRSEISGIQEQINLLDKDKKIRMGQSSLQKSYATVLKKWLKQVQIVTQKEDDDWKILKNIGVQSYEAGFKKMWKFMTGLDLMITKITQLQIIQLLKYDEMFGTITQDSPKSITTLTNISKAGFTPGFFQITQVILQRNKDLFSFCSDLKKKNPHHLVKQETSQLISELQSQNNKLNKLLEQLQNSNDNDKQNKFRIRQIQQQSKPISNNPQNSSMIFTEFQEKYQSKIGQYIEENKKLNEQINGLRIKLGQIKIKLQMAEEEIKNDSFKVDSKLIKAGSYEEAIIEEMQKMKKGFEKKIIKITEDFSTKEKEMRRKESEYRSENDRVKWQKSLLLKKFQVLCATK